MIRLSQCPKSARLRIWRSDLLGRLQYLYLDDWVLPAELDTFWQPSSGRGMGLQALIEDQWVDLIRDKNYEALKDYEDLLE